MRKKNLLDEFTWPEVYKEISKNPIAYFPVGPQEGHGKYLPMGTDAYIATAIGVLASRKKGGIVPHPLTYCFTGGTNAYRGTVSIPMHLEMEVIKAVIRNLWMQNFRAIFVVSIHGPNDIPIMMAIRELFEYERIVASYFNPYTVIDWGKYGYNGDQREAAMCYASMEVLGLDEFIPDKSKIKDDERPPLELPGLRNLSTGYHYNHIFQHIPPKKVDLEVGRKMIKEATDKLVKQVEDLKKYAIFIEKGGNPPFSISPEK